MRTSSGQRGQGPNPLPVVARGKGVPCEQCGEPTRCRREPPVGMAVCLRCFNLHLDRPLGSRKGGEAWRAPGEVIA